MQLKKIRLQKFWATALVLGVALTGCNNTDKSPEKSSKEATEITVSAAASLTESLTEISSSYESETGNEVNLNFGASGALQKQIEEGAPTDVFLSAGQSQMDSLEEKELLVNESRFDLIQNSLVLLASKESSDEIASAEDLKRIEGKIAIGEVSTVPAGQYAKECLNNLGIWNNVEEKLVFAKDVKAVLSYVESGEAAAGIVYNSDALNLKSAKVAEELDKSSYGNITYPAAIIKNSKSQEASKDFLNYLKKESSSKVFEKYGFDTK